MVKRKEPPCPVDQGRVNGDMLVLQLTDILLHLRPVAQGAIQQRNVKRCRIMALQVCELDR